jgi:hypothetical protein
MPVVFVVAARWSSVWLKTRRRRFDSCRPHSVYFEVARLVVQRPVKAMVAGSTPALGAFHSQYQYMFDRVAQLEERLFTKQKVEGSSPSAVITILQFWVVVQPLARRTLIPKVAGATPADPMMRFFGVLAPIGRAPALQAGGCGFDSRPLHYATACRPEMRTFAVFTRCCLAAACGDHIP